MGTQLFSLKGKTAAITEATRGIGRSLALAEAGAEYSFTPAIAKANRVKGRN